MGYPAKGSLLDMAISNKVKTTLDAYFAGPRLKTWLSTRILAFQSLSLITTFMAVITWLVPCAEIPPRRAVQ